MTTILVVDDEHSIVEFLATFLQEEGYQVVTAHNGEEGLDGLAVTRPAVVLCDVMMPVLDGREMCRRMQANPKYRSIPFVFMSAVSRASNFSECNYAALLPKPFDLDEVLAIVTRFSETATS